MDKSALSTWRGFVPSLDIKIAGEEPAVPQILKIDAIWVVAVQVATETLESSAEKAGFCNPAVVFDAQNGRVVRIHDAGDIKKGSEHRQKALQFCDGKNWGIFINLGHEGPSLYGLGAKKHAKRLWAPSRTDPAMLRQSRCFIPECHRKNRTFRRIVRK